MARSNSLGRGTQVAQPIVKVIHTDDTRNEFTTEVVQPTLEPNKNNVLRDGAITPTRLTPGKITPSGRKSNVGFESVRHNGDVIDDDVSERGSDDGLTPPGQLRDAKSGALFRKSAHYEVKLRTD